jgi:hypothetical protein
MEQPVADLAPSPALDRRTRRAAAAGLASLPPAELRARAERAVADNDLLGAIDLLTVANRLARDPDLEARLVSLRHHAFHTLAPDPGAPTWPRPQPDPFPEVVGAPPEVTADQLDAATLGGSILHHGCLLVRGLLTPERAAQLGADIDAAHDAHLAAIGGQEPTRPQPNDPDGRYQPFDDFDPPFAMSEWGLGLRATDQPCLMAADSPRTLFELLEAFDEIGLVDVIEAHLGERALLSIDKTTLRRTQRAWPSWHQDGSFITGGVRTVDCWLALDHCGGDSDTVGLDIVPRRFHEIVPFNDAEGKVPFVIPPERVAELSADTPVVTPEVWPGDALFFDELLLHCTGWPRDGHTGTRRAVEAWFFGGSHYPAQYGPLVC